MWPLSYPRPTNRCYKAGLSLNNRTKINVFYGGQGTLASWLTLVWRSKDNLHESVLLPIYVGGSSVSNFVGPFSISVSLSRLCLCLSLLRIINVYVSVGPHSLEETVHLHAPEDSV